MLSQPISVSFDIGGGRMVTIETGKIARQAHGSVTVRMGNSILMATVVANKEAKEGQDFFLFLLIIWRSSLLPDVSLDLSSSVKEDCLILKFSLAV